MGIKKARIIDTRLCVIFLFQFYQLIYLLLYFGLTCFKYLSIESIFSLLMLVLSLIIFALFAEDGADMYAANFSWSYFRYASTD